MVHGVTDGLARDLRARPAEELTDADVKWFVAETRKWIGKEIPLGENDRFLSEQPVDASEIRRFALQNRDANPLWIDRTYAENTRWRGIIAPPMFLHSSFSTQVSGTMPVQIPGLLQNTHFLHAKIELELLNPVRPGDLIKPRVEFHGIEEKTGQFAGRMFMNSTRTTFTNQKGDVLGVLTYYVLAFPVNRAQSRKRYDVPKEQAIPPLVRPDLGRWTAARRGAKPRYYQDVTVGDELDPLTYDFTIMDIVAQVSSLRVGQEFPQERGGIGCHWHYHPVTCFQVRAMPVPFDMGQTRYTWASRLVTDWIGDDGWVWKLNLQERKPVFAGDKIVVRGRVTDKFIQDDRHCAVIDIRYENQRSENPCVGNATVILPSR